MDRLVRLFEKLDFWLYLAFSLACVSFAARAFYGYMHVQTGGEWSAPLDDVFIHFDYARATARGYPFQWSEGNGFSSGNTSLSYPFVLAAGYWIGFRGMLLMQWAAAVACGSIAVVLGLGARLLAPFGRWAKYLLPPVLLSVGALDWSLFSGMENAFHLCTWALMLAASLRVVDGATLGAGPRGRALVAGLAGALLYLTRPESVVCVAAFAIWASLAVQRRRRAIRSEALGELARSGGAPRGDEPDAPEAAPAREEVPAAKGSPAEGSEAAGARVREPFPWLVLVAMGAPGAIALVAQSIANRVFTGEWAAAGAIAKLALNHPYMTAAEKWAEYKDLLVYVVLRNTHHHFADLDAAHPVPWGWLVPITALLPLLSREVRGIAIALWAQVVGWLLMVSLNGQVRWQNERYTMPAVAWLLVLAAMGLATLIAGAWRSSGGPARPERARLVLGAARVAAAAAIAGVFWSAQLPRMRDQIWFFGRASRNIRDQHVVAGRVLKQMNVGRVLVGDAGALIYASDRPGMDLIGLGGFRDMPFARAGKHGLGASLELIERLAQADRPDVMALYPGWWGDLPLLFGKRLTGVPVFGNVICGGSEKVIYRADWGPLDRDGRPRSLRADEVVVDEVDVADLVNEKEHGYVFPHPAAGFVAFRLLSDPAARSRDLFDAGRVIAPGQREKMRVGLPPRGRAARLVMRTSPEIKAKVDVVLDGRKVGELVLPGLPSDGTGASTPRGHVAWVEASFDLPDEALGRAALLELAAAEGAFVDYHLWVVAAGGHPAD